MSTLLTQWSWHNLIIDSALVSMFCKFYRHQSVVDLTNEYRRLREIGRSEFVWDFWSTRTSIDLHLFAINLQDIGARVLLIGLCYSVNFMDTHYMLQVIANRQDVLRFTVEHDVYYILLLLLRIIILEICIRILVDTIRTRFVKLSSVPKQFTLSYPQRLDVATTDI